MQKIYSAKGYEFFTHFDRDAKVYEIFLSETGGDYIGCVDTMKEAQELVQEWLTEQAA